MAETTLLAFGADNSNGLVARAYVASVIKYAGSSPIVSETNASSIFESSTPISVTTSTTYAVGTLDNLTDTDTFAIDLQAGNFYSFGFGSDSIIHGRQMTLFNELGQYLETTTASSLGMASNRIWVAAGTNGASLSRRAG